MRRWQAIVLAAFVLVAGSYGSFTTTNVHAGVGPQPNDFTVSVDCDTSTGAIDSACLYSAGTTSVTADVYLTNNSGGAVQIAAFNVTLSAVQQFFVPVVPGSCTAPKLNCNPDFNGPSGTGWSCDPVLADQNVDPAVADSLISCLNPAQDGTPLGSGATVQLFRVSYTTVNGVSPLTLKDVFVADEQVTELGTCNPLQTTAAICNNATITIGAAVATSTSTTVPTATPAQPPTATPCPGPCPTATRLRFVTVTPIVTPSVVPAATTAPAGTTAPGNAPPPPPAGTTGGAGSRPIRLPDTGEGNGGGAGTWLTILAAVTAVGAAGIASGAWFNARRRSEED